MKSCATCGCPLDRGATGINKHNTHNTRCLVCQVAATMQTFRYVPTYAPARRKPRGN